MLPIGDIYMPRQLSFFEREDEKQEWDAFPDQCRADLMHAFARIAARALQGKEYDDEPIEYKDSTLSS